MPKRKATAPGQKIAQFRLLTAAIGPILKLLRTWRGLTQQQLAQQLCAVANKQGIKQPYVSKVERSLIKLSMKRLMVWCEVLRCHPAAVLNCVILRAQYPRMPGKALLKRAFAQ